MKIIKILPLLLFCGCTLVTPSITPQSVKDTAHHGYIISKSLMENPPQNERELMDYLELNTRLWRELSVYYGKIQPE